MAINLLGIPTHFAEQPVRTVGQMYVDLYVCMFEEEKKNNLQTIIKIRKGVHKCFRD